jgi:hypothetical protein
MKKHELAGHLSAIVKNLPRVKVMAVGKGDDPLGDVGVEAVRAGIAMGVAYASGLLGGKIPVESPEEAALRLMSASLEFLTGEDDDDE